MGPREMRGIEGKPRNRRTIERRAIPKLQWEGEQKGEGNPQLHREVDQKGEGKQQSQVWCPRNKQK